MTRKNGYSAILFIPIFFLVLAIAGVFMYKLYSDGTRAKASEPKIIKTLPPLQPGNTLQPKKGYGSLKTLVVTNTPTPTLRPTVPVPSGKEASKAGSVLPPTN